MTLRRKMGLQISAIIVGLLLVSATGFWGLNGLRADYGLALEGYDYVRRGYEVGAHLATARTMLQLDPPQRSMALSEVQTAAAKFELMRSGVSGSPAGVLRETSRDLDALHQDLLSAEQQMQKSGDHGIDGDALAADLQAIDAALSGIITYTANVRSSVQAYQRAAEAKRGTTLMVMALVCGIVVLCGVLLGAMQYLSVARPLRQLSQGVGHIAAGQFKQRIPVEGEDELASLAKDFNRMAGELDGFYHQLEEKVAQRSNELVRSERLASVGYLAAGVAHEINNPLGIIAGYAEYSLEELRRKNGDAAGDSADLIKSLQVICVEAFRCKDITGKLLSLASPGDESRRPVCLADVADKVVAIVGGLQMYADRSLEVKLNQAGREELIVSAIEAEMQQVVLNLALNALQATEPRIGQVRIDLARESGKVELSVSDNGRGMSQQTLGRVFEPFFTDRRGTREAGTGLGLSITHRIIASHGGTIAAYSEGIGMGSRFVVSLPVAEQSERSQ